MRLPMTNTEYTQINTDENTFLFSYLGSGTLNIIKAVDKPDNDESPEIELEHREGIHSNLPSCKGIWWGKTSVMTGDVGLQEG